MMTWIQPLTSDTMTAYVASPGTGDRAKLDTSSETIATGPIAMSFDVPRRAYAKQPTNDEYRPY